MSEDALDELAEDAKDALKEQAEKERAADTGPHPVIHSSLISAPTPEFSHAKAVFKGFLRALEPVLVVAALAGLDAFEQTDYYLKLSPAIVPIVVGLLALLRNYLKNFAKSVSTYPVDPQS